MLNSVRGCICSGEVVGSRQSYRAFRDRPGQQRFSGIVRNQAALLILGLLAVL